VNRDHFTHRISAMGTKEKFQWNKWTMNNEHIREGNNTQECPHGRTPPSIAKSVAWALVLGTAFRLILLK
jgi:hypothetical protein